MKVPSISMTINDRLNSLIWAARMAHLEKMQGVHPKHTATASISFTANIGASKIEDIVWEELKENSSEFNLWFEDSSQTEYTYYGLSKYDELEVGWSFYLEVYPSGEGYAHVYAMSNSGGVALITGDIQDRFNQLLELRPNNSIALRVYRMGSTGPTEIITNVTCPTWGEIEDNYSARASESIASLRSAIQTGNGEGKLIIWHGPPGTGKTWAIRSLMLDLKETHIPINITDANVFLEDSSYYYEVINRYDKPCLFILEDAAEGILKDNRRSHGNRIAKLLNLTDGLVSQGRGDLFLVTFNEDIEEIDPAVVRPGRCLGVIEFGKFSEEEAAQWLRGKGFEGLAPEGLSFSLADLYGILRGDNASSHKFLKNTAIGFM